MKLKKVNRDPFSNGEEHRIWEHYNCDRCIKNSNYDEKRDKYTNADEHNMPNKCSILRDIMTRMFCNEPIKQETIDVCNNFIFHGTLCPYMKTERKKYKKKGPINQQKLDL